MQTQKPDIAWFEEQLERSGLSGRAVSLKLGDNVHKWTRIIYKEQKATIGEALALASIFGVGYAEILRRLGFELAEPMLSVIGKVGSSGRVVRVPPSIQIAPARILAPPHVGGHAVALYVDTPRKDLAMFNGQFLIYEPSPRVEIGAMGRLAVIECAEEAQPVVGVLERASVSRGHVRVFGLGDETLEGVSIISAAPVRWIMAA